MSSHAFYASMSPPPGVTMPAGVLHFQASAADTAFANGIRAKIAGSMNVGGRGISIPVAFRYTAGAAGAAARYMFLNPWLMVGLVAGDALYDYYKSQNLTVVDGVWKKTTSNAISTYSSTLGSSPCGASSVQNQTGTCELSRIYGGIPDNWSSCTTVAAGPGQVTFSCVYTPTGSRLGLLLNVSTSSGSVVTTVFPSEFETIMSPLPLPLEVPKRISTPLPVELPIIDPSPINPASPTAVPVPQPLRVPQGEPQPVPKLDPANPAEPQTYKSPVIDIVPAPKVDDPWRVDVQPKDIISESPTPLPETAPVPSTPPVGETTEPTEKPPGLCDEYPDILACKKFDEPEVPELQTSNKPISVTADSGWGSGNAACPAARHITVQGRDVPIPFDLFCQYMTGIRPIIIAMAWLSAGFILLGIKGGD